MIPNTPSTAPDAPKKRRHLSRRARRQMVIGAVIASMLLITSIVVVAAVTGGSRAGTLTGGVGIDHFEPDRKSTRLNSSHT